MEYTNEAPKRSVRQHLGEWPAEFIGLRTQEDALEEARVSLDSAHDESRAAAKDLSFLLGMGWGVAIGICVGFGLFWLFVRVG